MPGRAPWAPRCAAIVGPYSSGKTTLLESLLHITGAITKKWLEVGVLSTVETGLAPSSNTVDPDGPGVGTPVAVGDVFFFGNAVGGSGTGDSATAAPTNSTDEIGARNNPHGFGNFALVTDEYDYNKDRNVNATDQLISRNNGTGFGTQLIKINVGTAGPFVPEGDGDAGIASALTSTATASTSSTSSLPSGNTAPPDSAAASTPALVAFATLLADDEDAADTAEDAFSISTVEVDEDLLETLASLP